MLTLKFGITRLSIASISPICAVALRFARTILLSHLLSPNDLGAAVALMTILVGCEMITDVGLDRFVIVTGGGDRAQAVAIAQQITLGRAIFLAATITIFSSALAGVFSTSEHLKGVAWLGLVPLIAGFKNWRLIQLQQDYRYGPEAIATVCGQLAGVAIVVPAVAWLRDGRAIVVSLFVEEAVFVALSNLMVRREPVPFVDAAIRRAAIKWGIPLMINGVGLMAMMQLDRVIVANLFDLKTLALYALGLNLAIAPSAPLQAVGQKLGLPFLGNARANPQLSRQASLLAVHAGACVGAAYALPVGVVLDLFVPALYGRQYQVTEAFCALAMCYAFLRFCRSGPNMILLHQGLTSRLTVGNLVAVVGTGVSLALGIWSRRLEGVMAGLVVGEFAAVAALFFLVRRHLSITTAMVHAGLLSAIIGVAAAVIWSNADLTIGERALVFVVGGLMIGIDVVVAFQVGRVFVALSRQHTTRNAFTAPGQPG